MNRKKAVLFILLCFLQFSCKTVSEGYRIEEKDGNKLFIYPKKKISHYLPKNFGHNYSPSYEIENGIFIPNRVIGNWKINKIIIKVQESSVYDMNEKKIIKNISDKYAPFYINISEFDLSKNEIKNELFKSDSLVSLIKGREEIVLDISHYNYPFNKEGIFIKFKCLDTQEYKEIGYLHNPAFKTIGVSKKNEFVPYIKNNRLKRKIWKQYDFLIDRNNTFDIKIELISF